MRDQRLHMLPQDDFLFPWSCLLRKVTWEDRARRMVLVLI